MLKNLAIIPARSGSKGLKDKNIRPLAGKPLMAYTIRAALDSGVFDTVMVSTDSETYAKIAREFGAETPFLRSAANSSDVSSSWDAVREVLHTYSASGIFYESAALLQPTSPLRTGSDIAAAYQLFWEKRADTVVSVTEVDFPVQQCFFLPESCLMYEFGRSGYRNMRRQELTPYYRENGAVFITRVQRLLGSKEDIYQGECYAYRMPRERSLDIDDEVGFELAEILIKNKGLGKWNSGANLL